MRNAEQSKREAQANVRIKSPPAIQVKATLSFRTRNRLLADYDDWAAEETANSWRKPVPVGCDASRNL
jgi:hypothetical protein